jgi:sulfite exporter TauE/SafE
MCDCQNSVVEISAAVQGLEPLTLILNLFLLGITTSFSHCIGMCGSIAMGQATSRIINDLKSHKDKNFQKLLCCIAWEYYIGKALTYGALTCIVVLFGYILKGNILFHSIKDIMLLVVIFYFILSAIKTCYSIVNKKVMIPKIIELSSLKNVKVKFFNIHSQSKNIISRLLVGIVLGLIPCGMVYGAIGTIVANTNNILVSFMAAIAFGLGTFPGLFLISYSGNLILYRFKKLFDITYLVTLMFNLKILFEIL